MQPLNNAETANKCVRAVAGVSMFMAGFPLNFLSAPDCFLVLNGRYVIVDCYKVVKCIRLRVKIAKKGPLNVRVLLRELARTTRPLSRLRFLVTLPVHYNVSCNL